MSFLCRPLHIPAAKPSGEARVDVFKEQVLLLSLNQDSETVTIAVVVCGSCRPEVPDGFDREGPAVRSGDGCWLHIAG